MSCPPGNATLMNVTGMDGDAWSTGNTDSQEAVLVFVNVGDATTAANAMTQYTSNRDGGGANVSQNGVVVTVSGPFYPSDPTSDPVVDAVIEGSPNGNPSTQAPVIPAAAPSPATPAPAPTEAPAAAPTQAPATAAPAPVYVAPAASDAWSTAVAYTNDVNAGDNWAAWNLLSPSLQSSADGAVTAPLLPTSLRCRSITSPESSAVRRQRDLHVHSGQSQHRLRRSYTVCTYTVDDGIITTST